MIPNKVYDVLLEVLPMMLLFAIVMISIRFVTIMSTKEKVVIHKELKILFYIIYVFILFSLVTSSDFESYSNNFIPFKEIFRYEYNSKLFLRNVVGNILLFIPFGYLIMDMVTSQVKKVNFFLINLVPIITSFSIEIIQLFIGRSFDIDDIILNFIGAFLGYLLFKIVHFLSWLFKGRKENKKEEVEA